MQDHHDTDRVVASIARQQHGVFNRTDVLGAGGTDDLILHRCRTGLWHRLAPGVYALPGNPATWERSLMVAVLGEPIAVVSGLAGAALLRMPSFRRGRPEITVPRGTNHRARSATVHQSDLIESTIVDGIPVTTPAQTLIDIAGRTSFERLQAACESTILSRAMSLDDLGRRYMDVSRSRLHGIRKVRGLLEVLGHEGYVPPESVLEAELYSFLEHPLFPRYHRQHRFGWRGAERQRHDAFIPSWRVIVEGDGRLWHARVADFERDRTRDLEAAAHGILVVRLTWEALTGRREASREALVRIGATRRSGIDSASARAIA